MAMDLSKAHAAHRFLGFDLVFVTTTEVDSALVKAGCFMSSLSAGQANRT